MSSSLGAMQEEQEFLLRSLDDLEAEYSAGDMNEGDYRALKGDYTVRAADVIRKIQAVDNGSGSPSKSRPGSGAQNPKTGRGPGRMIATVVGLAAFAIGAGWLLAQASGERGASESLSGSIDESLRDKVLSCQQLMSGGQLRDSLVCFDEVLTEDPQNVEALTYKGWYLILASGSASDANDDDAAAELASLGERSLAAAVEVDPGFADARAFRTVVFERMGRTDDACAEIAVLDTLRPSPMITGLIQPVADRLACE